jgi:hypothetical protein
MAENYEPPRIEQRCPIDSMLIGLGSNEIASAAFRPL